jgi:hypothetical protein
MGCIRFKRFSVNASAGDANKGNDQLEDFTRPAGCNCSTLGVTDYDNEDVMKVYQTRQMV